MADFAVASISVAIVHDEAKGRCLVASRPFVAGEVVIQEQALCFASYRTRAADVSSEEMSTRLVEAYRGTNDKILQSVTPKRSIKIILCHSYPFVVICISAFPVTVYR